MRDLRLRHRWLRPKGEMGGDRGGLRPVRLSRGEERIAVGVADRALWANVSNGGSSGGDMRLTMSSAFLPPLLLLLLLLACMTDGTGWVAAEAGFDSVLTEEVVWCTIVGEKSRLLFLMEASMMREACESVVVGR